MLLSELAQKELIQVEDGIRYGFLADTDMIFNGKTGDIIGFEIKKKFGRFSFKNRQEGTDEYIPWEEIVLIGEHRILFGKTRSMSELNFDDK
ncbi:YlmC/YmxH family sporulation protein [Sporosarcina sp. 179-K 3D1 HS]|uniref:YlmC/YmxH family sporulation protein n=1 Tax=Sporosarcina sp. 179-K 3D1 HS TaxID=3232169 RepID=UPI00399F5FE6